MGPPCLRSPAPSVVVVVAVVVPVLLQLSFKGVDLGEPAGCCLRHVQAEAMGVKHLADSHTTMLGPDDLSTSSGEGFFSDQTLSLSLPLPHSR